jgi:hypothetical protein
MSDRLFTWLLGGAISGAQPLLGGRSPYLPHDHTHSLLHGLQHGIAPSMRPHTLHTRLPCSVVFPRCLRLRPAPFIPNTAENGKTAGNGRNSRLSLKTATT